MSADSADML